MRSARPLALGLVLVATSGGLAACGGGGGDEDAYVKTYQDTCTKLAAGSKDFATKLQAAAGSAGSDENAIVAKVKPLFAAYLDGLKSNIETLADADAPSKYSDYQDTFEDQAGKLTEGLDKARTQIEAARSNADLQKIDSDFGKLAAPPADLKKAAPACGQLNSGSGGTSTTG